MEHSKQMESFKTVAEVLKTAVKDIKVLVQSNKDASDKHFENLLLSIYERLTESMCTLT